MTATYTPEVAAARERLENPSLRWGEDLRGLSVDAFDLRLLLADHARLAEEAVKLRRVVEAAKEYRFYGTWVEELGAALAALAALEAKNG